MTALLLMYAYRRIGVFISKARSGGNLFWKTGQHKNNNFCSQNRHTQAV
ncbi:hypothetical protein JOC69_001142 [Heliobacterium gestii]|nr:hypothetical protein [Heliomicrobium gestii]